MFSYFKGVEYWVKSCYGPIGKEQSSFGAIWNPNVEKYRLPFSHEIPSSVKYLQKLAIVYFNGTVPFNVCEFFLILMKVGSLIT